MEEAIKILIKSRELKLVNGKYTSLPISEAEFEYAKAKGVMFPFRETLGHNECIERLQNIVKNIPPEDVANAFLYSLSTRKLEYRSALGSYWYAKAVPEHESTSAKTCYICSWDTFNDLRCSSEYKNEYNCLNYERFKYGGVRHTYVQYALFDLEEFLKLPKVCHRIEDEQILYKILGCVEELEPQNKAGALQKMISSKKLLKSNKNEVSTILDLFGICGILESKEHHCYDEGFYDCIDRNPPELTNDYSYPINWWKAKDGINRERLKMVFPFLGIMGCE